LYNILPALVFLAFNPAFAGMSQGYNADLLYRSQLNEFPSISPIFQFNGDAALPCINSGIGITAFRNGNSFESTTELKLSYSYHLNLSSGTLSGGASFGYYETSMSNAWVQPMGIYPTYPKNSSTYDLGFGLYYNTPNGMYVGFSTSKLANGNLMNHSAQEIGYDFPQEYYLTAEYDFKINSDCDVLPDAYIISNKDFTASMIDARLQGKFFWVGVGNRIYTYPQGSTINDTFIGSIGFLHTFKDGSNIKLGYSYDFPTSDYYYSNLAVHEINLAFCIKQTPKETVK